MRTGPLKRLVRVSIARLHSLLLSHPKVVACNICGWMGRRFLTDPWHKHIKCPRCSLGVRHRLFSAALQYIEGLSYDKLVRARRVLHFAPEDFITPHIRDKAASYSTADLLHGNCDFSLDMSAMPEVPDGAFDTVIAFDVLEHVPDYLKALREVHRILSPGGWAIFTVPQKDGLSATDEDSSILSPADRERRFGQPDHLRIFGSDFPGLVENEGFTVTVVDESCFPVAMAQRHVLFPPVLSKHPLATNHRKVFFCQKNHSHWLGQQPCPDN